MAKITQLSLNVINRVKLLRLVLGIPGSRLSTFLNHTQAYVFNVEKMNLTTQYPPHEFPKLAEALNCTIHDLLPADQPNSTGILIEKIVLSLSNKTDVKLVTEALIAHGFFEQQKTITDVAKHLFIEKQEQVDLLNSVIKECVIAGLLRQNEFGFVIA
jgi:hypothetical protein